MPDPDNASDNPTTDCYLAFDFGLRRIGIATGNATTGNVMPLSTVTNHHGTLDWKGIDAAIEQWRPVGLVVGRPVTLDGESQPMTREADGFMRRLRKRYPLPVYPADESYTSQQAETVIKKNRRDGLRGKTQKPDIDKIAAALILQRWLEAFPHDDADSN